MTRSRTVFSIGLGVLAVLGAARADGWPSPAAAHEAHEQDAIGAHNEAEEAFASPEAAYVGQLELMKGHLLVGRELLDAGAPQDAVFHYLHPAEELYGEMEDDLARHGAAPFKSELDRLATLVEENADPAEIEAAEAQTVAAIDAALAKLPAEQRESPAFVLDVALGMLRVAADEYAEAITDGRIANVVEYQDARGFVWEARRLIAGIEDQLKAKDAEAYRDLIVHLDALQKAWPTPQPPEQPVLSAEEVAAAVARIGELKSRLA